jgi:hypothetical protein
MKFLFTLKFISTVSDAGVAGHCEAGAWPGSLVSQRKFRLRGDKMGVAIEMSE